MRSIFFCVVVALLAGTASAVDLYVDNVLGDDQRDGRARRPSSSFDGPLRTITRALEIARAGDHIILAKNSEPYRESITLSGGRHGGSRLSPFVIEGNGATLDGSRPVPSARWEPYREDVFRFQPRRMAHAQLFLNDRPLARRAVDARGDAPPELEPKEWCLLHGWIYFRVEPNRLPNQYLLTYAELPVGITLYEVREAIVRDLIVQGFALDGVNAHDRAENCLLSDLTVRGNGRSGIAVGGASLVRIHGCLVGDNAEAQVLVQGQSLVTIDVSQLLPNTAPPLVRLGGRVEMEEEEPAGAAEKPVEDARGE